MKNSLLIIVLLFVFRVFGQVPDTETFSLQDVVDEILPSSTSAAPTDKYDLQDCIADAEESYYDPTYYTSPADSLLEFRNYRTPWELSGFSYSYEATPEDADGLNYCIKFKPDGSLMFILGSSTYRTVIFRYILSTNWDPRTAQSPYGMCTLVAYESLPQGIEFQDDGTSLYVIGSSTDKVYQFDLSTPWVPSTVNIVDSGDELDVNSEDGAPTAISIGNDGDDVFILGQTSNKVYKYELVASWRTSTSNYYDDYFNIGNQETTGHALAFNSDGTKMYILGIMNDAIYQYTLSTSWDITSASYDEVSLYIGDKHEAQGFCINPNGKQIFTVGEGKVCVWELN